jgi:hypothetical protein
VKSVYTDDGGSVMAPRIPGPVANGGPANAGLAPINVAAFGDSLMWGHLGYPNALPNILPPVLTIKAPRAVQELKPIPTPPITGL